MSTLADALDHAVHGRRVLWFGINNVHAGLSADQAIDLAGEHPRWSVTRVSRVNGGESIRFASGGSIQFMSVRARGGVRGTECDVAYLPHWSFTQDPDLMADLVAAMSCRTKDPRIGVVA